MGDTIDGGGYDERGEWEEEGCCGETMGEQERLGYSRNMDSRWDSRWIKAATRRCGNDSCGKMEDV